MDFYKEIGGKMKKNSILIIAIILVFVSMLFFCVEINSLKEENEALKQLLFQKDTVTTVWFPIVKDDSIIFTYTYDAR